MKDVQATPMTMDALRAGVLATFADPDKRRVIDDFHRLYYGATGTWGMTHYRGIPVLKSPMDLWAVQDVLWALRPELVIETGTAHGGSALFYADCLARNGYGHVVTIDLDAPPQPVTHPRMTILTGGSLDADVVADVQDLAANCTGPVVVILDSDHSRDHVLAELDVYAPLVTVRSVLIVEDTNICGNPVDVQWKGGPGPGDAVAMFLAHHHEFVREPVLERSLLTFHPGGWLMRVA